MKIGKLEEVEIRDLWKHEEHNFSPWLAKEENIEELNKVLGLTLIDVDREVYVGAFQCDLVAKDETTGMKIIIENQLERSDHDHLGKIITYASGLGASVVVWIVKEAREEHRSAIEWLNNNTNENLNFFLIELHAYKIGDSLPAPKFEVIEQPNGFTKISKPNNSSNNLTKSQSYYFDFWTKLNEMLVSKGKPFNANKPNTDHWYGVAIGKSGVRINIVLVNSKGKINIELYINNNKGLFDTLFSQKQNIENELELNLDWQRLDDKMASRIAYAIEGLNFEEQSNYNILMEDIIDKTIKMRNVFSKYI